MLYMSLTKLVKQYPWLIVLIILLVIGFYALGRIQYNREMREGWSQKKRK